MQDDGPRQVNFGATRDGLTQLRRRWPCGERRGAVLMVHGIGEHSGRYLHVGDTLAAAGFDVLMADNRGFGQTGTTRGHVDRFSQFLDDIEDLLAERRTLGVPVILLGHSLGGLMVARYLVSGRPPPDLAVLSAPAIDAVVPRWQRIAAPILSRVKPSWFVPSELDAAALTRDPEVQAAYTDDPLRVGGATARLGHEVFMAMDHTQQSLDRIRTPTYVLHGAEDTIVPPEASSPIGELDVVTRREWPGLRHECLNEPEWPEVLGEIVDWIEAQLAGGISQADPVSSEWAPVGESTT